MAKYEKGMQAAIQALKRGEFVNPTVADKARRYHERKKAKDRRYREDEKNKEIKLTAVTERYLEIEKDLQIANRKVDVATNQKEAA